MVTRGGEKTQDVETQSDRGGGHSGGHGGTASETSAPAPTSASMAGALLPPQNFLGEINDVIGQVIRDSGLLGALGQRGAREAPSWRRHWGVLLKCGLLGALWKRGGRVAPALGCALEVRNLGGALEVRS